MISNKWVVNHEVELYNFSMDHVNVLGCLNILFKKVEFQKSMNIWAFKWSQIKIFFVNCKAVDDIESYKFGIVHDNIWGHLKKKTKKREIKKDVY